MYNNKASASAPGTCGEWVQGQVDGRDFLVSMPIDMWSNITVSFDDELEVDKNNKNDQTLNKAVQSVNLAAQGYELKGKLKITRTSELHLGKGMASSTADIIAAYMATNRLLVAECIATKVATAEEIAKAAVAIEPSDSTMFTGICKLEHKTGAGVELLGVAPPITVVMLDTGGTVDTRTFNDNPKLDRLNKQKEVEVTRALEYLRTGLCTGDLEKVGYAATLSAIANQKILYKPFLPKAIKLAKEIRAIGVNVAHSGTLIGILLAGNDEAALELADYIYNNYVKPDDISAIYVSKVISGGIR